MEFNGILWESGLFLGKNGLFLGRNPIPGNNTGISRMLQNLSGFHTAHSWPPDSIFITPESTSFSPESTSFSPESNRNPDTFSRDAALGGRREKLYI